MAKFLQKKAERNFLEKAERNVEKLKKAEVKKRSGIS